MPEHAWFTAKQLVSFFNGADDAASHTTGKIDDDIRISLQQDVHKAIGELMRGHKPDVHQAKRTAHNLARQAASKAKEQSKNDLHQWLDEALKKGAGEAHKWTNKPNALPPLQLTVKDPEGNWVTDPDQVAVIHARPWLTEWETHDQEGFAKEIQAIKEARERHIDDAPEWASQVDLSPSNIRKASATFPGNTAIGVDNMFFRDFGLMPDNALEAWGNLMRQCIGTLTLPVQTLTQVMTLLGKKSGGSRTIAILSTTYRLLMRILSPYITEWDLQTAEHWDSALQGNSALRAHVARALDMELANFEDLFVLHFLWDMRKFYDSIRTHILVKKLEERGYPPHVMILGLIAHKAPRVLSVGPTISEPIVGCGRSMIAGCQQSVSWARGLMFDFVQSLGYILPGSVCSEHVDDLSHVLHTSSRALMYNKAIEVGQAVNKGIKELDLRLADKSVLTCNDKRLGAAIATKLKSLEIPVSAVAAAEDLGIETAAGARRCAKAANKRVGKAAKRGKRTGQLARINSRAKALGLTGTHKQQCYGHTAQGASKTQTQAMRRNLKSCTPLGHTQSCLTTTLAWYYGAPQDPEVSLKVEQVAQWIDDWKTFDAAKRKRIHSMWRKMLPTIGLDQANMWSKAKGPIVATICVLYEAGWKPLSPVRWFDVHGNGAIVDGAGFGKCQILAQLQQDIISQLWMRSEKHHYGSGLKEGADLHPARKAKASLIKEGKYSAAKAIDYLVCGALSDPVYGEEGPNNEHRCQRCNTGAVATRKHELHECEANWKIDDPHIRKTNWVPKEARKQWEQCQCLYARGILPESWMPKQEEIDYLNAKTWESANFKKALDRAGSAHSDGSGGSKDIPRNISKVAFGAVSFDIQPDENRGFCLRELACIGGEVPGKQTVPRAELWGAIQTSIRADPAIDLEIGIDAAYVTNGINKRNALLKGTNGDLWSILFDIIDLRQGSTTLIKVKSHLDEKGAEAILNSMIRFDHLVGNTLADKVAGAAARRAQPSASDTSKATRSYTTAFCVAKRLAIIQADIWRARQEEGEIYDLDFKVAAQEVNQQRMTTEVFNQFAQAGHRLVKTSKGHKCNRCCKSRQTKQFGYWKEHACRPRPPAEFIIDERKRKWVDTHGKEVPRAQIQRVGVHDGSPQMAEATLCAGTASDDAIQVSGEDTPQCGETKPEIDRQTVHNPNKRKYDESVPHNAGKETADVETSQVSEEDTTEADTNPGTKGKKKGVGQANGYEDRTQSIEKDTAEVDTASRLGEDTTDAETSSKLKARRPNASDTPDGNKEGVLATTKCRDVREQKEPAAATLGLKVARNSFDNPDDDHPVFEDSEEECPWDGPEDNGTSDHAMHSQIGGAKHSTAVNGGKRLRAKTNRLLTVYSNIKPRGRWQDQRRRKCENAKTKFADKIMKKAATNKATNCSFRNISALNKEVDKGKFTVGPYYDWGFANSIDPSHVIAKVRPNSNAIFCQRCSYYNNGGPLRRLKASCPLSIPKSRMSLIKLLRKGRVPTEDDTDEIPLGDQSATSAEPDRSVTNRCAEIANSW